VTVVKLRPALAEMLAEMLAEIKEPVERRQGFSQVSGAHGAARGA
jgi:hypothetical protein